MKTTYTDIDAFNAKARLSQLLQEVKRERHYRITADGQPIADLVPSERAIRHDVHAPIEWMRNIRKIGGLPAETLAEW